MKGKHYAPLFGPQSAQLLDWFEEFLLGLKFPHAVQIGPETSNRRFTILTLLTSSLYRYELELKTRAAAMGTALGG